jgi:Cu-Zn family superoxide dismutase
MRWWMSVLLAGSCWAAWAAPAARAEVPAARAVLHDAKGNEVGTVTFSNAEQGVAVDIDLHGFPPGVHAFHIHEKGACEAPDFKSAGGHFNPTGAAHGFLNAKGPHAGDLPNITVGPDSTLQEIVITQRISLEPTASNSIFPEGGTSVVVHENADDYVSNPAGDAGPRIACGVIERTKG